MATDFQLTSTTAPGKEFSSRAELAAHYKSDWHKYNLKRREAGLPMLLQVDFQARLDAALALRQEKTSGKDHLKNKKNEKKNHKKSKGRAQTRVSQVPAYDRLKEESKEPQSEQAETDEKREELLGGDQISECESEPTKLQLENEAAIEIDPRQCLFDRHVSASVEANIERMQRKYGFFIPDAEYLSDKTGLVGYCHEKIKLGHTCLYCQRVFTTWQGCQKHMISKLHTKLRYEAGIDLDEYAVFYDFSADDAAYLGRPIINSVPSEASGADDNPDEDDDNDDEWEDVSDDDEEARSGDDIMENELGNDDDDEFEEIVARMGFDVTELGELILPDGRIVGHRTYRRYYKQRTPRSYNSNNSEAVTAARLGASERLYRGQVYRIGYQPERDDVGELSRGGTALIKAGIAPGRAAGRAAKGLLVSTGGSFSSMSIYRYKAAMHKQQMGEFQGRKLYNKTNQNINRMDKKHNRLMNGVSVAHAAR